MQHNITLLEEEFKKIESGNRHIITRDNSLFAIEDILTIGLSGHREQMVFVIENIERKRLFKGWCLLEFKNVGDFFKNSVPEMILNEGNIVPQNFPGVIPTRFEGKPPYPDDFDAIRAMEKQISEASFIINPTNL